MPDPLSYFQVHSSYSIMNTSISNPPRLDTVFSHQPHNTTTITTLTKNT